MQAFANFTCVHLKDSEFVTEVQIFRRFAGCLQAFHWLQRPLLAVSSRVPSTVLPGNGDVDCSSSFMVGCPSETEAGVRGFPAVD